MRDTDRFSTKNMTFPVRAMALRVRPFACEGCPLTLEIDLPLGPYGRWEMGLTSETVTRWLLWLEDAVPGEMFVLPVVDAERPEKAFVMGNDRAALFYTPELFQYTGTPALEVTVEMLKAALMAFESAVV